MFLIKVALLPVSFLYGVIVFVRNRLFDMGILSSKSFDIPVISVGNITVGGTGKSPHVEYLIRLLKQNKNLATLSRGYKRSTKGFLLATDAHGHHDIGDEPLQFYKKFPEVKVSVDEKRVHGVTTLMNDFPKLEVVLLDDAFQHRWIVPGLNILLIRYSDIGDKQFMMPSGYLREWRRGRNRADVIIVTKSPEVFSPIEARRITSALEPKPYQKVFFSYVKYLKAKPFTPVAELLEQREGAFAIADFKVLLVSGIQNSSSLRTYLEHKTKEVKVSDFDDHHDYSIADLLRIINEYDEIVGTKKIIITTEKDSMRLLDERLFPIIQNYPVFYVPIEILIHHQENGFDTLVKDYVRRDKRIS
ncbi:MAG: tetraacyldisaccharide 4'-kinase [Saprospiraceae bacterium]|jgi:tetraacyldisaccharide 4'-kinase